MVGMLYKLLLALVVFSCASHVFGQHTVSGRVVDSKTGRPVEYASVTAVDRGLWAIGNEEGAFIIKHIAEGEVELLVSCLGYVKQTFALRVSADLSGLVLRLTPDDLRVEEVVVTAKIGSGEDGTSYVIDHTGLEHLQMLDIADAMALLPGGQTNRSLHLATSGAQRIALRSAASGEGGNPTFGTAIEVDGVRLSNNASVEQSLYGIDTRNIASGNVESVEVLTGIASVAYGDMTNGVVRVNTRKGRSPLAVEMTTKPNTKLVAANKGIALGAGAGVLNASVEYARSVAELASPYTAYDRNGVSLLYENTFNRHRRPLTLSAGVVGNVGGYDSQADPDAFQSTYVREKDHTLRAHIKLNYLANTPWLTGVELSGTLNYADRLREENVNKSSSSSVVAIHTKEEGYFIAGGYDEDPGGAVVLIPGGYWYERENIDSKPLVVTGNVKLRQSRRFGSVNSGLLLGFDVNRTTNGGKGQFFDDMRYAPTWREYRYDGLPAMNSVAGYVEERVIVPLGGSVLNLTAGLRGDLVAVEGSDYGRVGSWSPRVNVKYTFRPTPEKFVKRLSIRGGWGRFVKLPSFAILHPEPSYRDILAFAPGAEADGTIRYGYYVMPSELAYNAMLKHQSSKQAEIGVEVKVKGVSVQVSAYHHKTNDAYRQTTEYRPFSYKLTEPSALEGSRIPTADRIYTIDRATGVVTIADRTGTLADETLAYRERNTFRAVNKYINASPTTRKGIEWVVDFDKIQALQTSIRLDGNYYHYRGTNETIEAYSPYSQNMADGNPYKYVGYYVGSSSVSNGSEKQNLSTNLTLTTHVPEIRMIFSLRVEATLLNYTQNLSEYESTARGFALDDRGEYFPSGVEPDHIYNSNRYVGVYPLYYTSYDDMETKVPFAEKLAWARENDRDLYNELAKLVGKTNTDYYFNGNGLSAYYSANISVTKEIGDHVALTFHAVNFLNNTQLLHSGDRDTAVTIYGTTYIPRFYYGLALRVKI